MHEHVQNEVSDYRKEQLQMHEHVQNEVSDCKKQHFP